MFCNNTKSLANKSRSLIFKAERNLSKINFFLLLIQIFVIFVGVASSAFLWMNGPLSGLFFITNKFRSKDLKGNAFSIRPTSTIEKKLVTSLLKGYGIA